MLKRLVQGALGAAGLRLVRLPPGFDPGRGYTLYPSVGDDGEFDYERYREIQIAGNKQKRDLVWVIQENVEFLSRHIRERLDREPRFGICHGTRRGLEQQWFSENLGCEVIGTEISDTATQYPRTIHWDFHDVKPEWLDAADFIYSNSFDHTYDPQKCLDAWVSCVRRGGLCIIEHSSDHSFSGASELDPFGADIVQMPYLIATWGQGRYAVREILRAPVKPKKLSYLDFLVIQRFS